MDVFNTLYVIPGMCISIEKAVELDDHHPYITLAALVKDAIDTRMFFQCDESAIMSSIASSTNSSGSDDSANYSQKSTITLEDLDNFDNEIRQSEC